MINTSRPVSGLEIKSRHNSGYISPFETQKSVSVAQAPVKGVQGRRFQEEGKAYEEWELAQSLNGLYPATLKPSVSTNIGQNDHISGLPENVAQALFADGLPDPQIYAAFYQEWQNVSAELNAFSKSSIVGETPQKMPGITQVPAFQSGVVPQPQETILDSTPDADEKLDFDDISYFDVSPSFLDDTIPQPLQKANPVLEQLGFYDVPSPWTQLQDLMSLAAISYGSQRSGLQFT